MMSLKNIFNKNDIVLLICLIAAGLAALAVLHMTGSNGNRVVIAVGGTDYGTYALNKDRTVVIRTDGHGATLDATSEKSGMRHKKSTYNKVVIKSGAVSMAEASCKNQICVHHAVISKSGQSIVCLPNRIVVRIESDRGEDYDAISN